MADSADHSARRQLRHHGCGRHGRKRRKDHMITSIVVFRVHLLPTNSTWLPVIFYSARLGHHFINTGLLQRASPPQPDQRAESVVTLNMCTPAQTGAWSTIPSKGSIQLECRMNMCVVWQIHPHTRTDGSVLTNHNHLGSQADNYSRHV